MNIRTSFLIAAVSFATLLGCSDHAQSTEQNLSIQLTSSAFLAGHPIPDGYTSRGADVSPPLQWSGAPPQAKSFAVICDDPDAPMGTFTHWIIFNLPATTTSLAENIAKTETLPDGSKQGKNGFDKIGYNGPAPPPGKLHHYHFQVYALDAMLNLNSGASEKDAQDAMDKHILGEGELIATYEIP
jgi:Raf kinase inhibitor-like YbhB/YbcL family protein